ncbi:CDP-diacylglycerol--glycerol-3-phosphate 3-phosphatidyltransferase [Clostridium grantii]|uniref:CDP-diacylglycerol--glycerol-3-phosphate 3-phosphatidyltransferase n=1 Tax=Clostridium grantii DSM 8605 TaxID=1121316 RepID=A0A1M5QXV8_9CLOT|nr:CDP-diacylglycerol--glycerol-3-phosphate 3-phosphatidyltransferase [Clostridium grantii]SHH18718.1 CDP-diacylglycerol--glycerol-3-phosphate 3-phosphatidyltransferase [Clostridium grantii DSM 8605]
MNLANKLTIIRIFLVPIFLVFVSINTANNVGLIVATLIFIIAAITDKLDGYIARSRNQITSFGKFLDPLADKLLVSSALVSLVELGSISAWFCMVIIAREFAVTGLRTVAAAEGNVIAASEWGKIKTVIQIVAIIAAFLDLIVANTFLHYFTVFSLYVALIITIISGIDYFVKNKNTISVDK